MTASVRAAPLLEMRDICVSIGGVEVLSNVSFSLLRGSALAIVGETGSGKSMTCRVIDGLLDGIGARVTSGSVSFNGVDLLSLSPEQWQGLRRHRIAFIPQSSMSSLNPVRSVGSQLSETIRAVTGMRRTRERQLELLQHVHLENPDQVLRSYPHQLSGGMRQRVMIALALVGKPDLLIADEPTTALDVSVQRGILKLIADLQIQDNLTLILVTHDLGLARFIADGVVVMNNGRVVESGPVLDTLANPRDPYTRALIAARPSQPVAAPGMVGHR